MNRIPLKAQERTILGKHVKKLRQEGLIPAHVFGKNTETEHVSVGKDDFMKVFHQAGETGLVDLKIGEEKIRPVLIRDIQFDARTDAPLNIDFYQVNLSEKVKVPVPVVLIGEQAELVRMGEAVVIQPISEVEVEALPTELPEKIEVDITSLQQIDDAITVSNLQIPEGVTVLAEPDAVVAKLDKAITEEMAKLLEEEAAAAAAATEAAAGEAGEVPAEGEGEETPQAGEEASGGDAEASEGQKEAEEPSDKASE